MARAVRSAAGVLLVLSSACAHGIEDDFSGAFPLGAGGLGGAPVGAAGNGNEAGNSMVSGGPGGGGADGFGGAAGTLVGSAGGGGSGGAGVAAGGSVGSGGAATGGSTVAGGNGGGSDPDAGQGGGVSDASRPDAAGADADAACVRESNVAFCLRLQKNCGNTTAPDNCGNTTTFNCGTCVGQLVCGGGGQPNVCGMPTNLAQGGTVTASNPGVSPEDMTKAFDGSTATKWFAGNGVKVGWIAYQFAAAASHTVTSYVVTSANDVPGRDPSAWQLQGSNDGQTWTTVDTRTAQTFAARFQSNTYTCGMPAAYPRYRLNITANAGGTDLQLADIQLLGF